MSLLPDSFRLLTESSSMGCRTEVLVLCWLFARHHCQLQEATMFLGLWLPCSIFKTSNDGSSPPHVTNLSNFTSLTSFLHLRAHMITLGPCVVRDIIIIFEIQLISLLNSTCKVPSQHHPEKAFG